MWTRERRPNNMVINDPKGELLVKFYVRGTMRGFQIVQFNLINAMFGIWCEKCLAICMLSPVKLSGRLG